MTRLFLCEKPSQARDIARVVGATRKGDGCLKGDGAVVTWCFGHLMELAPPEAYDPALKTWSFDTLPILPGNRWRMEVKKSARKQFAVIKKLLKSAKEVVIATDADREGELIAREILSHLRWQGRTLRLWLSALDDASIRKALANMLPGGKTEPLYYAGLARSRADWLVGMNLTRLYTLIGRSQGVEGVLSVGRVQTPTLRLVVERDREIESFVPQPYWDVEADCVTAGGQFTAKWDPDEWVCDPQGRCTNRQTALNVAQSVSGAVGHVVSAESKEMSEQPPLPFELAGLQQVASKRWGMSASRVQEVAQSLYETHKATTYPRTDCPYLPLSQLGEAGEVLDAMQRSDPELKELVQRADLSRQSRAWNDKKITAHHAIIPTAQVVDVGRMSDDERKIYDLIRRRYLAQFFPEHRYRQTTIVLSFGEHRFKAGGNVTSRPGWKEAVGVADADRKGDARQPLPRLSEGDDVRCAEARVLDKETKPPAHYTEGTLTQAMKSVGKMVEDPRLKRVLKETSGIGTVATRAAIIEVLLQRGYMRREGKKKYLVSTPKGRALLDVLPEQVKDPAMTALWEQALDDIASGVGSLADFMSRQSQWVSTLIGAVRQEKTTGSAPDLSNGAAPVHACPDCSKPMRRRKGTKGYFWGCTGYPDCKTTLPDSRGKPGKRSAGLAKGKGREKEEAGGSCPDCGKGRLIARTINKGRNAGKRFLGCSGYPKCHHFSWIS